MTLFSDQINGRPCPIVKSVPYAEVVIHGDRVRNSMLFQIAPQVSQLLLIGKLRRMHANDNQTVILILLMPIDDIRLDIFAVPAAEGPELNQNHFAAKPLYIQRFAV